MKIWMSPSLIRVLGILIILTLVKNFLRVVKNYCMKCIMSMEQILHMVFGEQLGGIGSWHWKGRKTAVSYQGRYGVVS